MIIKHGSLFICLGTTFSYGEWIFSNVTFFEDNTLKIEVCTNLGAENPPKVYHLSPEWFIITPRATAISNCPTLPDNKKQDGLFALAQPSNTTIWFLASSKYERNQWIEKILPIITLKPPTPPEPPPPYSEYDNLSYFPWASHASTTSVKPKDQNAFTFPRPNLHRSGFYSLERPVNKEPKPSTTVTPEATPLSEPISRPEQSRDSLQCINCFSLGCAFICNTLSVCLQMCCNNFSTAF